jgi:hypothetical protein
MTTREKFRAYTVEPVLATLILSIAVNCSSLAKVSGFMRSVDKDALSILVVLLAAVLAVWIGLFWIAATPFGMWLSQHGEREDIDDTYIYSIWVFLISCIAAVIGSVVKETQIFLQVSVAWLILVALLSVVGVINNTRGILRLHARFMDRSSKITTLKSDTRNQDAGSGR